MIRFVVLSWEELGLSLLHWRAYLTIKKLNGTEIESGNSLTVERYLRGFV